MQTVRIASSSICTLERCREAFGLALSSRNRLFNETQKEKPQTLQESRLCILKKSYLAIGVGTLLLFVSVCYGNGALIISLMVANDFSQFVQADCSSVSSMDEIQLECPLVALTASEHRMVSQSRVLLIDRHRIEGY